MTFKPIKARLPKSVCLCGHDGDGPHSEHSDLTQEGHGACLVAGCDCTRFTWSGFTQYGHSLVARVLRDRGGK